MSVKVMNWVWEESQAKGNDRLVLLAIADCADDNGMNAFPSKQKLADKTLLDVSTIRRVVKRLEEAGYLSVDRSSVRGRANVYTVHLARGIQPVGKPVDNSAAVGAARRGGDLPPRQTARLGEAERPNKGGTAPPLPSGTIPEPSSCTSSGDHVDADHDTGDSNENAASPERSVDPVANAVLSRLGPQWHLSEADRRRLSPLIVKKVIEGWHVNGLAHYLSANPDGVVSSVAVLSSRLQELPAPKRDSRIPIPRPQWCGQCDQVSRQLELDDGRAMRCPRCHPLRAASH